jgi:replicative DNA helicase
MSSVSVRDVIKTVFKDIADKDEKTGEPIGFDKLNASIGGFNPGELILVIGKPDTGKTEFCIKMA